MKANNHEKPVHDRRPVLGDLLGAGTCLEGQGGQEIAPGFRPMVAVLLAAGAGAAVMGLRRMLGDGPPAAPYLSVLCAFLLTMALAMALKWYAPIGQDPGP